MISQASITTSLNLALAQIASVQSVLLFDRDQIVVGCNPVARDTLGYGEALLGKTLRDLWASESMTSEEHDVNFAQASEVRAMANGLRVPVRCISEVRTFMLSFAPLENLPAALGTLKVAVLQEVVDEHD